MQTKKRSIRIALYGGLCLLAVSLSQWNNKITAFVFEASYHYFGENFRNYQFPLQTDSFPYIKQSNYHELIEKPNVFIVLLRACNASFVEAKNGKGSEFTPNINHLKKLGLSVENFYGNTTNAKLGQFSVLAGINPGFQNEKKPPRVRFNSLAKILAKHGYTTIYFDGAEYKNEEIPQKELEPFEFQSLETINVEELTNEEKHHCWGQGLRDDFLYKRVFITLDNRYERKSSSSPFFSVVAPVSYYPYFNEVPDSLSKLYPNPKNELELFSNSIYLEDYYLKSFFKELNKRTYLKNSLVVVLGVNSYPAGEHGYTNQTAWYEDRFKVPLLLIWPGKILPGRISDMAYSHIDVAPTIMDLVRISSKNHFIGRSLMDTLNRLEKPIYLTQPYDGKYLAVVKFPLKYVKHEKTGNELLFNLLEDPLELKNLIDVGKYKDVLATLRNDFKYFYFNQTILNQNRVWPERVGI